MFLFYNKIYVSVCINFKVVVALLFQEKRSFFSAVFILVFILVQVLRL